ncbi:DUF3168 domain-containing protein [Streptomyces sp. NPDC060198]|uniref:DUF3168 domain-containing protein n=1 Tax=Streptomyces sp. NPDC060198 TaxID=3347070 RepID=UPI00365F1A1C
MTPSAPETMLPIQRAVYAVLTGDEPLGALIAGVYDYLPETADYPFVVIGEAIETPDNSHDRYGRQTVITLHVWTQARGHTEGLTVAARVTALLDHRPLVLDGLDHVSTRHEYSQTLTDPEPPGNIRHVVLRYRVITEQPPPT